jgi:SAM-dependent methyltransferase
MNDFAKRADFYPDWLEQWWTREACRLLGTPTLLEAQAPLEKEIQRLSDLFTTGRTATFGDYGKDERLLLAYGLFYFPQTFVRTRFPLREALILRHWHPSTPGRAVRLLDLGAGLGGATLGAAALLQQMQVAPAIEALAVDQSAGSLATLSRLARENQAQLPGLHLETERGDLKSWWQRRKADEPWDLILASFSLGEAFYDAPDDTVHTWVKTALSRLSPGGLLLITEPSLRETSERLERLRNRIAAEQTGHIWAPCPHHHACPLLENGKFWCHEVRRWQVPESLAYLNRHLFRSVRDLKFSFLLLGPPPPAGPPPKEKPAGLMRLVSPMSDMKGRYLWTGCAGDGLRYEYEIQKRTLSREDQATLEKLERGDLLEATQSEPLGNPQKRRVKALQDLRSWSQTTDQASSGDEPGRP